VIYKFNTIELDTTSYQIKVDGIEQSVEPQVFNLIVYLIENKDKIISREEILDTIWKDRVVSDSSINNHIKSARKVLQDDGHKQAVIKTVHSRGYQFIAECEVLDDEITEVKSGVTVQSHSIKYLLLLATLIVIIIVIWQVKLNSTNDQPEKITDNSIAVLAFADLSPDSDQDYFAQGISEELLNLFTRIPDLKVASRTSSFSFKNKDVRLESIGKELKVKYIMEGSVRKSGDKLRVTAQLIRVDDGSHLWSETYDHNIQDVFKIQDEIAQAVSNQLEVTLSKENKKTEPVSPEANTLYLKSLYYYRRNTVLDMNESLKLINESVEIFPNNVLAWTLKSRIHYKMEQYNYENNDSEPIELARESIKRAREINNQNATANAQMALINLWDLDFSAARYNIDLAMSAKNKTTATTEVLAYYFQLVGQIEKSVELLEKGIEKDPLNDTYYHNLAIGYLHLNHNKDAYYTMSKYNFFHKEAHALHGLISQIYLAGEKNVKALEFAQEEQSDFWKLYGMSMAQFANGNIDEADILLNDILIKYSQSPAYIASLYAFRKEADNAFKWLEVAFENQDTALLYMINFYPFRNLWEDSRWKVFINKINLPNGHWLIQKE